MYVPSKECIEEGNRIKEHLELRWSAPSNYYHLRAKGHVGALRFHMENSCFAHLDIANFFGSINRSRVTRALKDFYSYSGAREAANNSTVRVNSIGSPKYVLPFGFIQSPIIASICLSQSRLGRELSALNSAGVRTSVYMDDIVLSSNDCSELMKAIEIIHSAAERSGFSLNPEKREGPAPEITAFNIILSNNSLVVTQARFQKFRDAVLESDSIHQIHGIVGYVGTVNHSQANELADIHNGT